MQCVGVCKSTINCRITHLPLAPFGCKLLHSESKLHTAELLAPARFVQPQGSTDMSAVVVLQVVKADFDDPASLRAAPPLRGLTLCLA